MFNPHVSQATGAYPHLAIVYPQPGPYITRYGGPGLAPPLHQRSVIQPYGTPDGGHWYPITRARVGASPARNKWVVNKFITGRANAQEVLQETAEAIYECGVDLPAAGACIKELLRCASPRTGERVVPNHRIYMLLLTAHKKAKSAQGASAWFDHLLVNGKSFRTGKHPQGIVPTLRLYEELLTVHWYAADAVGATYWFNHLLVNGKSFVSAENPFGIKPSVKLYNSVLLAHMDAGDAQGVINWFNHLLVNGKSFVSEQLPGGVVPNARTYGIALSTYRHAGDAVGAYNLCKSLEKYDPSFVNPRSLEHARALEGVIWAYENVGDTQGATLWRESAIERCVLPSFAEIDSAHNLPDTDELAVMTRPPSVDLVPATPLDVARPRRHSL
jgi:hypothetical protein